MKRFLMNRATIALACCACLSLAWMVSADATPRIRIDYKLQTPKSLDSLDCAPMSGLHLSALGTITFVSGNSRTPGTAKPVKKPHHITVINARTHRPDTLAFGRNPHTFGAGVEDSLIARLHGTAADTVVLDFRWKNDKPVAPWGHEKIMTGPQVVVDGDGTKHPSSRPRTRHP